MVSHRYLDTMAKTEQVEAFSLYLRDWSIPEIAREIGKTSATIRNWSKRYGWRLRKAFELRDIEEEMHKKVMEAREKIIDVAAMTVEDIIVRDEDGKPVRININIENTRDLKTISEVLLKVGGVPEKVEQKTETKISGGVSVKTETIDPTVAAEIGKVLALKNSVDSE